MDTLIVGTGMNYNALCSTLLLIASLCFAQSPQTRPVLPDGGTRERLISIFIPNLPNAPFTATVNTEWVRVLPDGSRITLVNHRLIARDSAGRIFQGRCMLVPRNGKQQSFVNQTEITDPILKQQYICIPSENTCQLEFRQPLQTAVQPLGGTNKINPVIQSIGTRTIGGVEAIGTRETIVVPAGEIGNESPINTSREFWFSPKLGLNLISVRDDPRFGTQRFELSDIMIGEPDAKLLSPAEGSRIIDLRNPPESEAPNPEN
jgi:hypothetical protein